MTAAPGWPGSRPDAAARAVPIGGEAGSAPAGRLAPSASANLVQRSGFRARDWNPDVRIGLRAGLDVVYLSQRNEIHIPQLHINSSMAGGAPILSNDGHVRMAWRNSSGTNGGSYSGTGYASSGSSGSSGGSMTGGGSASSGGASSGGSSSGGGGGGGHIRN